MILESTFECVTCSKVFVREHQLTKHSKTHNLHKVKRNKENCVVKPFECTSCGNKFTSKANLSFHALSHTNSVSKSQCEFCGQSFLRLDHLQRHKRLHNYDCKTKQCRCTICSIWIDKDSLKTHMK